MLKQRKKTSHKGQNGTVLIIGGSEDYIGAPTFVGMTAIAVIRSGADLVYVASPEKTAWAINCIAPDLMTKKLKGKEFSTKHIPEILKLAKKADVITIGNGITITPTTKKFMQLLIKKLHGKQLIIDAAALRVIKIQDIKNAILLPHEGELKELLKNSKITEKQLQKNLNNNVLVKKGHPKTLIITKNEIAINTTGNAGMTHGGTGDVLAGITAGLWAQGNTAFESAKTACYVNGKAADNLKKRKGYGYIASDLINEIPKLLK